MRSAIGFNLERGGQPRKSVSAPEAWIRTYIGGSSSSKTREPLGPRPRIRTWLGQKLPSVPTRVQLGRLPARCGSPGLYGRIPGGGSPDALRNRQFDAHAHFWSPLGAGLALGASGAGIG